MKIDGHSNPGKCEGKIEERNSPRASGLCLHIGLGGAMATQACAATSSKTLK